jgi:hypothetical protein
MAHDGSVMAKSRPADESQRDLRTRWQALVLSGLGLVTALSFAACGSQNSASSTTSSTAKSVLATTPETTTTSSAASPGGSNTWQISMKVEGGYVFQATLALQGIAHAKTTDVGSCQELNLGTDAEVAGTLTLTNKTPGFSAEPGINLWFGTGTPDYAVVDSSGCEDANTNGAVFYATSPLRQGQSIHESIFLVIPDFYSPQFPDGDSAALSRPLALTYQPPGSETFGSATYTITGPSGRTSNGPNLSLSTFAR